MLAYCVNCKTVKITEQLIFQEGLIGCSKCMHEVLMLDADRATLSEAVKSHHSHEDAQPVLRGAGMTYSPGAEHVDLLECEERLRLDEFDYDAAVYIARYAYSHFRYLEAEQRLKRMVTLHHDEIEPKQLLSNVYLILKRYDLALALCESIRKSSPHDIRSFFNLGLSCYYSERFFRAILVFQKISERADEDKMIEDATSYLEDCLKRVGK